MTTLVLLPGLDGTGKLFQPFIRELPAGWRVHVLRYPPDERLGYDALASLALSSLPGDGRLVLLGESFSGPVAIRLAVALGSRVQALLLCCTFARNPRPGMAWLGPLAGVLPPPAVLPTFVASRALLGANAAAAVRGLLAQALAELPAAVLRARLRAVLKVDVLRPLAQVGVPVLYLQALQDRIVPPAAVADLLHALPTLEVVRIDGPHGLLQTAPKAAADAMLSFLANRCQLNVE